MVPVPVVRSRSRFLFAPDLHLARDKGGFLVGHHTSLSCLPPFHSSLGKSLTSPMRLVILKKKLQGVFHRGQSVNSQLPGETLRPHCLHILVAFPDNTWDRKHLLSNLQYQPANCLSYQPDKFYVENNVCY